MYLNFHNLYLIFIPNYIINKFIMETQYQQYISNIKIKDCLQITVNSTFLQSNFELIKECLKKISSLKAEVAKQSKINKQIVEKFGFMQKDLSNCNMKNEALDQRLSAMEKKQFLNDIYKKIMDLQTITEARNKEVPNFQQMIKKMGEKFVFTETFKVQQTQLHANVKEIAKIKDQLQRFVDFSTFKSLKNEFEDDINKINKSIQQKDQQQKKIKSEVKDVNKNIQKINVGLQQHQKLLKQINFNEIEIKLRKFRDEISSIVQDMNKKVKKIVSSNELNQLQKDIVTKVDEYLANQNNKLADKSQTKKALIFLESRINLLINPPPQPKEEDFDSLFATKQWICAACTTNLGKYEGKLNKYKPWAVFPCRELSPQKSGGYGYLNYLDKVSSQKGVSLDDTNLDRLNDTGISFKKEHKHTFSKPTNLMSSYGETSDDYPRLFGEYFKSNENQKQEQSRRLVQSAAKGQRTFRVKKQSDKKQI